MAIMMLCTDIAIDKTIEDFSKPFTVVQWSNLAQKLFENGLEPKDLFQLSSIEIRDKLNFNYDETERVNRLLARSAKFALNLTQINEKGISVVTRADEFYPRQYKNKLKRLAPPVLFYSGNLKLFKNPGVAIVGSRNIDETGINFTKNISQKCTFEGMNIVSGGAKGVDSVAEETSLKNDGTTILVLADSLEKKLHQKNTRNAVINNSVLVLSPFGYNASFKTYAAMERNKYIYALADYSVVVASDYKKGGTWSGAIENLKNGWTPLFVLDDETSPEGNKKLIDIEGTCPLKSSLLKENSELIKIFKETAQSQPIRKLVNKKTETKIEQIELF
jgi:predicted Rossmann fold nucleotide-binding protein DprA/Smf involved in DNA uptake